MIKLFGIRDFLGISEFLPKELYFLTVRGKTIPKEIVDSDNFCFFSVDNEIVYKNFYGDFGPVCLLGLYRFCNKLRDELAHFGGQQWKQQFKVSIFYCEKVEKDMERMQTIEKPIIFHTCTKNEKRANAAFLIGSFAILYLGYTPCLVNRILHPCALPFAGFQDAVMGNSPMVIEVEDCFNAIHIASIIGLFNYNDFNPKEFEYIKKREHGNMSWIVPEKLLALPSPCERDPHRFPVKYANYFLSRNISDVIALNSYEYDVTCFDEKRIRHHPIHVASGCQPTLEALNNFFEIVECTEGGVAVHCQAGLGRTGTFIAAYLIKHYRMTARQAIAWVRICRPGSVTGFQQCWLEDNEGWLQKEGDKFREAKCGDPKKVRRHTKGIYSYQDKGLP